MRQPMPLITADDIMRLESEIATVAASPGKAVADESQESDPPIPAFLLRKDPEECHPTAPAEEDGCRGRLLAGGARTPWLRPENPWHVAWLIPAVSLLTGGLLGMEEIWIGWLAAPMLVWLAFVIVGATDRSLAAWSGTFQALTVVQSLTTTAVTIDWVGRGIPVPGMVEWVSFAALPILAAGTFAIGRVK